jgi:hypothetical protein
MFDSLLSKLRACQHKNTNAYDYIRNDGMLDEMLIQDDYRRRQQIRDHMTGMRFCLDCGATQRYRLWDPLSITNPDEREPWLAPWLWRK